MTVGNNFNQLYIDLIENILNNGHESAPRGLKTKELICYTFKLTNPKDCLCAWSARKLNYAFSIIEKMEYLTGINIPERLCFYNDNMKNFINETTSQFDGAYAPRFGRQLIYIYNLLKKDKDTRQAVLNINNETDHHESKNVACTINLQFLIRENKLHLIVNMRSNDILLGTPYDVNAFCFIQEVMASWLGIEIGYYFHSVGSLHAYLFDENKLKNIISERYSGKNINEIKDNIKNPTFDVASLKETYDELSKFWYYEEQFRHGDFINYNLQSKALSEYLEIIKKYCAKKLTA